MRGEKKPHSSMKQCWNQGNEIIFISWKNIFYRKMQKDRKAFMAFSIIDVHTYELASVVTESQTETNINHFQVTSSIIFPKGVL